MNVSEAMKLKSQIKNTFGIDLKMLDIPKDGLVLYIERKALEASSYKLLADFTVQNNLSLQLDLRQLCHFYQSPPASLRFIFSAQFFEGLRHFAPIDRKVKAVVILVILHNIKK